MDMDGGAVLSSDSEHFHNFPVGGAWRVIHAHAFGESAPLKAFVHQGDDFGELFGRSSVVSGVAGGEHTALGVAHHFHAHGNMANAYAKIDQGLPFPEGVPASNVIRSSFELERCGDAVAGLELVVARLLAVFVEVDETGGDD